MRTYDTYKDSGISWLGQIPSHWELYPMKRLFSFGKGLSITKADLVEFGKPVISYGQVHSIDNPGTRVNEKLLRYVPDSCIEGHDNSSVSHGDFIFADTSEDLAGCGNCAYIDRDGIYAGYHSLIAKGHGRDNKYFAYMFLSDKWRYQIRSRVNGIKVYSITKSILSSTMLIVPPRVEQEAIVAYLDKATAEIDKAIASQQRMVELLQERKQIIINQAVTQGLNPDAHMKPTDIDWLPQIPTHWDVKMFKHLYRTRTGITFTKAQLEDKGERVISYGQIHSKLNWYSSVNPELIRYIPESLTCGCDGALAYKGDFLFADTSEDFEGCGNCIYVDTEEPIYAGYHTILAKKNNEEHGEYLAFLFASTNWRGQVRSAVNGVKVYSITQTILNNTSVILPPVNEQKLIADYIQSAIKPIDAEISRCEQKIALLTERKQILINDVVTGKIKVV